MEGEGGVTWSIIHELRFSDIQGDQMESEIGVSRSFTDEVDFSDTEGDIL